MVPRTAFFVPEPFPIMQDGDPALLAKSRTAKSRLFNAFPKHLFGLHVLVGPVWLYHRPRRYPKES